jgi:integrase
MLRHTCASQLLLAGRTLKEVQEILGHADLTMTLRYAHLGPSAKREAAAALDNLGANSATVNGGQTDRQILGRRPGVAA